MFLLEKKAVTSLGKWFWLVKLKESKPQWKNRVGLSYRGSSTQWLADLVPRLWCTWPQSLSTSQTAESQLECEPPHPKSVGISGCRAASPPLHAWSPGGSLESFQLRHWVVYWDSWTLEGHCLMKCDESWLQLDPVFESHVPIWLSLPGMPRADISVLVVLCIAF